MPSASDSSAAGRFPSLLRKVSSRPSEELVHKFRTTIRRIETTLNGTGSPASEKLRRQFKKLRKRAGMLRDIDVQLALLRSFHRAHDRDVLDVENELLRMRERHERKIKKLIEEKLDAGIVKRLRRVVGSEQAPLSSVDLSTIAREFSDSLVGVGLNDTNLHSFRALTKKLRYKAELTVESATRHALISELKKVQDAIGIWHDGVLLSETATAVLGDSKRNSLLSIVRAHNRSRFLEALRAVEYARTMIPAIVAESPAKKPARSAENILSKSKTAIA